MFLDFYLVKNDKIAYNSATTDGGEKIIAFLESFEFQECFAESLTNFKNNKIFLHLGFTIKLTHLSPVQY